MNIAGELGMLPMIFPFPRRCRDAIYVSTSTGLQEAKTTKKQAM